MDSGTTPTHVPDPAHNHMGVAGVTRTVIIDIVGLVLILVL